MKFDLINYNINRLSQFKYSESLISFILSELLLCFPILHPGAKAVCLTWALMSHVHSNFFALLFQFASHGLWAQFYELARRVAEVFYWTRCLSWIRSEWLKRVSTGHFQPFNCFWRSCCQCWTQCLKDFKIKKGYLLHPECFFFCSVCRELDRLLDADWNVLLVEKDR